MAQGWGLDRTCNTHHVVTKVAHPQARSMYLGISWVWTTTFTHLHNIFYTRRLTITYVDIQYRINPYSTYGICVVWYGPYRCGIFRSVIRLLYRNIVSTRYGLHTKLEYYSPKTVYIPWMISLLLISECTRITFTYIVCKTSSWIRLFAVLAVHISIMDYDVRDSWL